MASQAQVPDAVKINVRAVLLSKVGGVPLNKFIQDYKALVMETLNYKDFGFLSLQDFLKSMPEIARIEHSNSGPKAYGVGDPDSYLPIGARKAQGKLPKDYHKKLKRTVADQSSAGESGTEDSSVLATMGDRGLLPDQYGLYSICCPLEKAPSEDKMELENLFNQAGAVVRTNITSHYVFVRYRTTEEIYKAIELFKEDYDVQIAKNSSKDKSGAPQSEFSKKRASKQEKSITEPVLNGTLKQNGVDVKFNGKGRPDRKDRVRQEKEKEKSSLEGKGKKALTEKKEKDTENSNGKTLFVNSIPDQHAMQQIMGLFSGCYELDDFLKLIDPYNPRDVRFSTKAVKNSWYGFVEMHTQEDAARAIKDLNRKQLGEKYIIVDYHTPKEGKSSKQKSEQPVNGEHKKVVQAVVHSDAKKSSGNHVPVKSKEYADMPPLVDERNRGLNEEYYKDCTVFVGNFPSNTTLGSLQEAFSKYNVQDICITNTRSTEGCNKAFLYLASVSDVIKCVSEMNSFELDGRHIKVDVPYQNKKMRYLLTKLNLK